MRPQLQLELGLLVPMYFHIVLGQPMIVQLVVHRRWQFVLHTTFHAKSVIPLRDLWRPWPGAS